jgi:hypothetical protein
MGLGGFTAAKAHTATTSSFDEAVIAEWNASLLTSLPNSSTLDWAHTRSSV